jgi:uncharacterized protein YndB with AHSA1/START domain
MPSAMSIVWPARFDPRRAPVHVRNEIRIDAECDRVWAWLIRAQAWPSWYPNAHGLRFEHGHPPDLQLGTRFRWHTFGVRITSTVQEFVPPFRIGWDARGPGVDAYHAWLLEPDPRRGCRVLTEETQHGFLARLGHVLLPHRMYQGHALWLDRLRDQASRGLPPDV